MNVYCTHHSPVAVVVLRSPQNTCSNPEVSIMLYLGDHEYGENRNSSIFNLKAPGEGDMKPIIQGIYFFTISFTCSLKKNSVLQFMFRIELRFRVHSWNAAHFYTLGSQLSSGFAKF